MAVDIESEDDPQSSDEKSDTSLEYAKFIAWSAKGHSRHADDPDEDVNDASMAASIEEVLPETRDHSSPTLSETSDRPAPGLSRIVLSYGSSDEEMIDVDDRDDDDFADDEDGIYTYVQFNSPSMEPPLSEDDMESPRAW